MRRPRTAFISASAGSIAGAVLSLGLSLSAQVALAQQPAQAPSTASAPTLDPMAAARNPRSMLQNGIDFIKYKDYTRALRFLREAERRKAELSPAEQKALALSIAHATKMIQDGSVKPSPATIANNARRDTAVTLAGAMALAADETPRGDAVQLTAAEAPKLQLDNPGTPTQAPDSTPPERVASREVELPSPALPNPSTPSPAALEPIPAPSADALPMPTAPKGNSAPVTVQLPPADSVKTDLPAPAPAPLPDSPKPIGLEPLPTPDQVPTQPAAQPAKTELPAPAPLPDSPKPIGLEPLPTPDQAPTQPQAPAELPKPATLPDPVAARPAVEPETRPVIGLEVMPEPKPAQSGTPAPSQPADAPAPLPEPGQSPAPPPVSVPAPAPAPLPMPAEAPAAPAVEPTPVPTPAPADAPPALEPPPVAPVGGSLPAVDAGTPAPPPTVVTPEPAPAANLPLPPAVEAPPAPASLPMPEQAASATERPVPVEPLERPVARRISGEPTPPIPPAVEPPPAPEVERLPQSQPVATLPAREVDPAPRATAETTSVPVDPTAPRPGIMLPPDVQEDVARIARRQREDPRPGTSGSIKPLEEDLSTAPNIDTPTRFELPRPPSSTEARPLRRIPVPEEFVPLAKREWEPIKKYWAASATCHMPLYFQDANLERYGNTVESYFGSHGRFASYPLDKPTQSKQRNQILQPFFSAGLFAFQVAALPYNMVVDPPWEAEYDLGYYRPGDRVPPGTYYLPLTGVGPPLHGAKY